MLQNWIPSHWIGGFPRHGLAIGHVCMVQDKNTVELDELEYVLKLLEIGIGPVAKCRDFFT